MNGSWLWLMKCKWDFSHEPINWPHPKEIRYWKVAPFTFIQDLLWYNQWTDAYTFINRNRLISLNCLWIWLLYWYSNWDKYFEWGFILQPKNGMKHIPELVHLKIWSDCYHGVWRHSCPLHCPDMRCSRLTMLWKSKSLATSFLFVGIFLSYRGVVFWWRKLIPFEFNGWMKVTKIPTWQNRAPHVFGNGTQASCNAPLKAPSNLGDCKRR